MVREDAEALRRRLYAPDASVADLEAYREAGGRDAVEQEVVEREPGPDGAARSRPRHRRLVPVVAAAALVAAVVGIGIVRVAAGSEPPLPAPTALPMTADDRAELRDNLARGGAAGIAAYLLTHTSLRSALPGATRFDTVEGHGVGDGTVTLSPVVAEAVEGRASVLLVLEAPGDASWTTLRRQVDTAGEQLYVRQVERGGAQQADVLTAHTYRYTSGDRPVQLQVHAPAGVRWGAAVLFSD